MTGEAKMIRTITIKLDAIKTDRYQVTDQGFLTCQANVTRAGVFDYQDDAGKTVRELRAPEEVFAEESLSTLRMIPLTFQHPEQKRVTVDNNRQLNVGVTGENVTHDDEFVSVAVKIMDKAVVGYVLDRHRQGKDVELSCGYDAQVLPISGEHPTEGHYDAVQKNIRYNHLSIVPRGRAGHNVKLKLDQKQKESVMIKFIRKALKLDGFAMDAIEAEVPEQAQGLLERLTAKLDEAVEVIKERGARIVELVKKSDADQAKIDTLSEQVEKLKADNAVLSDPAGEKIQAIIAGRKALEDVAAKLDVKTDGLTDQAIKVAVISKQSPEFKADAKSADYIDARFDAVVELLTSAESQNGTAGLAQVIKDAKAAGAQTKVDHRAEFIEKSRQLSEK
jgi:hypothetical protein